MKLFTMILSVIGVFHSSGVFAATIRVPSDQPTIQAGIDATVNGDAVLVADGTYSGAGNKNLDFSGKNIIVKSENGPGNCIIDCQNSGRGLYCDNDTPASATFEGFSIINGSAADGNGGGVYYSQCTNGLTLKRCVISNCTGTGSGGGIAIWESSNIKIENCVISNNTGGRGAGICFWGGASPNVKILNCTIVNNSGTNGAISFINGLGASEIKNSIIYFNSNPQIFPTSGVNVTYSDIQTGYQTEEGNISADPLFVQGDEFYHIRYLSPCRNGGIEAGVNKDLDGESRPLEGACDIGADEIGPQGSPTPTSSSTPSSPSQTPQPSSTPNPSPTVPFNTPTARPEYRLDCSISSNQIEYYGGETMRVNLKLNNYAEKIPVTLYIVIEVFGKYYFWPSFTEGVEGLTFDLPANLIVQFPLFNVQLPNTISDFNATFYLGIVSSIDSNILGLSISKCYFHSGSRSSSSFEQSKMIGPEGGILTIDDGTCLEIPVNALSESTLITLRRFPEYPSFDQEGVITYGVEPSGLRLLTSGRLRVKYNAPSVDEFDENIVSVYSLSELNPESQSFSEVSKFSKENTSAQSFEDHYFDVIVSHFSYFYAHFGKSAYIVIDYPPEYMKPGDLVYALTKSSNGNDASWFPGHCGIYTGYKPFPTQSQNPCLDSDRIIESMPPRVSYSHFNKRNDNDYECWINRVKEINMGVHRPKGIELTSENRFDIIRFAETQIGKDYWAYNEYHSGFGPEDFSCIGLTEKSYEHAGVNIVPFEPCLPYSQFWRTKQLDEIWVTYDTELVLSLPIRVVSWDLRNNTYSENPSIPKWTLSSPTHPHNLYNNTFAIKLTSGDKGKNISVKFEARSSLSLVTYSQFLTIHVNNNSCWECQNIDSQGSVGRFSSLSLDSGDYAHVCYLDATNDGLKYARESSTGWFIESVDGGNVGEFCSLELNSNNNPNICYFDRENESLKYAEKTSSGWHIEQIDSGNVGEFSSIALSNSNRPHVSYFDRANQQLKYATKTSSGWQIEQVDSAGGLGVYTSICLDDSNYPHIGYFDFRNEELKYAYRNSSRWEIEIADNNVVFDGSYSDSIDIVLDSDENPHITYSNELGDLKYAWKNNSYWRNETLTSSGRVSGTSIDLDSNNKPYISFTAISGTDLKIAQKVNSEWLIEKVDFQGRVGYYSSIKLDSYYNPIISYYDYDNQDLKIAKTCNSNCDDANVAGGDNPVSIPVNMGQTQGTFIFDWDMRTIKDQMIITYEGNTIFDTGCLSGTSSQSITFSGSTYYITVNVQPNCEGVPDTWWEFTVHCPTQ